MCAAPASEAESDGLPISFAVPEQFDEIALDEAAEQRARRQYQSLSRAFRGIDPEQCVHMVLAQEMALGHLIREGAIYASSCLARSEADPTRAVTAQFSVLIKEAELYGDRPLLDVAKGLKTPGEPQEVILNEFPAGEALVVGEEVLIRQPITLTGKEAIQAHRIRQAQIIFPLPGKNALAMLTMSTESIADWHHFVAVLNRIAHSVSFKTPNSNGIADRLDGIL